MPNVLITGVNGFVGHHLAREMQSRDWNVWGVGTQDALSHELDGVVSRYYQADLADASQVAQIELGELEGVVNLAGLANVGASFDNPELYKRVNVEVLAVLGRLLIEAGSKARVVAISTGAVYDPNQELPLHEDSKVVIGSPYSESKLLMEESAAKLRESGLDCVVARPFNHFGPGQGKGFLIPDLKDRLLKARDEGTPITVGNLNTRRDYTDVRDVAKAYADLLGAESLDETLFNVCSGASRSGQEILDLLLKRLGLDGKLEVVVDPALIRPNDPPELYGSFDRLNQQTGWKPSIPFEQTIEDFLTN